MRVGLRQEGDLTGTTAYGRYHQLIGEVELADWLGFSTWGTSEQHFSPPSFSITAPEVLYSAIAMRTSRITLRTMASVMLKWNHPILVAERLATLGGAFDATDHSSVAAPNDYRGLYVATAYCAQDRDEARAVARDIAMAYFTFILNLYVPLSKNPGYTYLGTLERLNEHQDDLDWLCEYTPSVMIGTPDDFIERIRRVEAMGIDEVLLRIDGVGHENIKTVAGTHRARSDPGGRSEPQLDHRPWITVPPRRSERVSEELPAELRNRCAAIQDSDAQGIPLTASDYVWLAVATVVVPVLLVIIGLML
ncbi:LLM class flavin-dependent oxidoreductase [Mycolicibacterium baixiangningiae]|uniref:LLM class flavin-dependent oxidoreductase n=1 Tax=Mycolicibacterium baixiangningiae TaxID=2761578 RepID=UPI0018D02527|nr:LLM class flavin-dependent oxidoreductase [Mycolicibacterium baixiangningiae]